jgi:hypothetical protein
MGGRERSTHRRSEPAGFEPPSEVLGSWGNALRRDAARLVLPLLGQRLQRRDIHLNRGRQARIHRRSSIRAFRAQQPRISQEPLEHSRRVRPYTLRGPSSPLPPGRSRRAEP